MRKTIKECRCDVEKTFCQHAHYYVDLIKYTEMLVGPLYYYYSHIKHNKRFQIMACAIRRKRFSSKLHCRCFFTLLRTKAHSFMKSEKTTYTDEVRTVFIILIKGLIKCQHNSDFFRRVGMRKVKLTNLVFRCIITLN